jgi:hypothetical protein
MKSSSLVLASALYAALFTIPQVGMASPVELEPTIINADESQPLKGDALSESIKLLHANRKHMNQNVRLDVEIKSGDETATVSATVLSGTTFRAKMGKDLEYIASESYTNGVLTERNKASLFVGSNYELEPSITPDGSISVSLLLSRTEQDSLLPKKKDKVVFPEVSQDYLRQNLLIKDGGQVVVASGYDAMKKEKYSITVAASIAP